MGSIIKFKPFFNKIKHELMEADISDYDIDAALICSYVLKVKKLDLMLIDEISTYQQKKILKMVNLRKKHIPVQYLTKSVEFLNCVLYVNKNVLIPRNETELLAQIIVNKLNNNINSEHFNVLDLCCGSGALGIAIKANTKIAKITFADISTKALKITKKNAITNNLKNYEIIKSDLFEKIKHKNSLIVCNPPYIKTDDIESLDVEVKNFEPVLALDGGPSGLEFYEKIIKDARNYLHSGGCLCFEIGINQENDIEKMFTDYGYGNIETIKDYNEINRFIMATYVGK